MGLNIAKKIALKSAKIAETFFNDSKKRLIPLTIWICIQKLHI